MYHTYLADLNYRAYLNYLLNHLTNLTYLVIIAKEVKIVKEAISCDVLSLATS